MKQRQEMSEQHFTIICLSKLLFYHLSRKYFYPAFQPNFVKRFLLRVAMIWRIYEVLVLAAPTSMWLSWDPPQPGAGMQLLIIPDGGKNTILDLAFTISSLFCNPPQHFSSEGIRCKCNSSLYDSKENQSKLSRMIKQFQKLGQDWRCLKHSSRLMAWRLLILGGNFQNILFVFSKLCLTWPDGAQV